MKKNKLLNNNKGFTLIELLAVIVIMGILMMVAIPAMTTFMENARKDTFINIAESYINAARYKVLNDGYSCGGMASSALSPGDASSEYDYYIRIGDSSAEAAGDTLLEDDATSPWGTGGVEGFIGINVEIVNEVPDYTYGISFTESKDGAVSRRGLSTGSTATANDFIMESALDRKFVSPSITTEPAPTGIECILQ